MNNLLKDKNFRTRTGTAVLFVAVVISGIFIHRLGFYLLMALIGWSCLYEFLNHTLEQHQKGFRVFVLITALLPFLIFIWQQFLPQAIENNPWIFTAPFLFVLFFLQLGYTSEKPFSNLAYAFFGMAYTILPSYIFMDQMQSARPALIFLCFALVWVNDTGAYIGGSLFGKHKLMERISPKKTWEGTIGGLLLCILTASIYGKLILGDDIAFFAGLGLLTGICATLGDLVESQFKRSIHIKDSGTFLPGHGGFLDRFDGFLPAMPAICFYLSMFR